jgi:hypothetical protein
MTSVLDDPASRLYAGALLGKALTKELGEVGAQQEGIGLSARKATLEAGVASGKLNAAKLSRADAGLLGSALTNAKVPSLVGDPLGFLGTFAKNFASGAGEFADSLKGIPQGLLGLGEAGLEEGKKTLLGDKSGEPNAPFMEKLGLIGKSVAHDFSSPTQIYNHPFNPLLDVASVASLGAGGAVKGAQALARAGKLGDAAEIANSSGVLAKLVRAGSPLGREDAVASPAFTAKNIEHFGPEMAPAKIPRAYSTQLGMKYAVQKPLDAVISKLRDVQLPGRESTIGDLQGQYYGKKLINTTRAQISAGTNEAFHNGPVKDFLQSTHELYKNGSASGQYQFEATMLHSLGINNLSKLDEYVEALRNGEDVDGLIMTPDMQKAAEYRAEKLYQDPRFRQLIEHPTDAMKEVAYHLRRMNVEQAVKLGVDPLTSENSAFGRLRTLTAKTNEEIRAELPAALRPTNKFAKGLQVLQEAMQGKGVADHVPSVQELAYEIPYGTIPQKMKIVEQAVESLKQDLADTTSPFDRAQDPNYLQGNNLFEKIATALHDQLGVDTEQAASFARGVTLGSSDGPILPTYVPSVSGEKLKFGIRREPIRTQVGRVLGVSKFRPITDIERQPTFYDFKRPFNPRTASANTIGLGPAMNYTKDANYAAFVKGAMRLDPEAIARNAYQIQRDLITGRMNDRMIDRLAIKAPDGKTAKLYRGEGEMLKDLGTQAALYKFVPIDTWRNYFKTKTELQFDTAQALKESSDEADLASQIEGISEEAAQRFVGEEEAKAASGNVQGVALPQSYVNTIIAHARLTEGGNLVGRTMSFLTGRWKSAVLSLMPSWLLRTTLGHGLIAVIDGTVSPKFWTQAHDYFSDRPVLPEHVKEIMWGNKYGDHVLNPQPIPMGVNQGGMTHELEDLGQGNGPLDISKTTMARTIQGGVHVATNYQRRAIFLHKLDSGAKARLAELGHDFEHPGGFWNAKNIDAVLDPAWRAQVLQYPDLVEHAFDQLSKVSYTFGEMSPWERKLVKNGMPFYGWYKFISKFAWSLPVNYPGRAFAIAAVGRLGSEEVNSLGAIPDYLHGALWFDHSDLSKARYINLYGLNPLNDFANPMGDGGLIGGLLRLGQFSPLIQAAMAGYGINPITGETEGVDPKTGIESGRYGELIDTKTGKQLSISQVNPLQRALGTFLRAFPEIRAAELMNTGGNPVYAESIPLLSEHPIATSPIRRRGYNVPGILGQEFGVKPENYDIAKNTALMLKKVNEARKKNVKTVAKAKAKLALPNP